MSGFKGWTASCSYMPSAISLVSCDACCSKKKLAYTVQASVYMLFGLELTNKSVPSVSVTVVRSGAGTCKHTRDI